MLCAPEATTAPRAHLLQFYVPVAPILMHPVSHLPPTVRHAHKEMCARRPVSRLRMQFAKLATIVHHQRPLWQQLSVRKDRFVLQSRSILLAVQEDIIKIQCRRRLAKCAQLGITVLETVRRRQFALLVTTVLPSPPFRTSAPMVLMET
jgi:hypothetical protein